MWEEHPTLKAFLQRKGNNTRNSSRGIFGITRNRVQVKRKRTIFLNYYLLSNSVKVQLPTLRRLIEKIFQRVKVFKHLCTKFFQVFDSNISALPNFEHFYAPIGDGKRFYNFLGGE